jgi:PPOX class probable F420-dependent enzyme
VTNPALSQFANEKYLNLETYRRDGTPVLTPVWFAEENGILYIYSLANAGKVKRIRNNVRVRVAPCDMRGKLKGDWVQGRARILAAREAAHGHMLLDKKYGLMKKAGNLFSKLMSRDRLVIAIELD